MVKVTTELEMTQIERTVTETVTVKVPRIVVEGRQAVWLFNLARASARRVLPVLTNEIYRKRIEALFADITAQGEAAGAQFGAAGVVDPSVLR